MSSQVWALEQMTKHKMFVDFGLQYLYVYQATKPCTSHTIFWGEDKTLYEAIAEAVTIANRE